MAVANPREVPEYELNPQELQVRKGDGISKVWSLFYLLFQCSVRTELIIDSFTNIYNIFIEIFVRVPLLQGTYQVAKWNGTKVSLKILDKDSYSDPESMYVIISF